MSYILLRGQVSLVATPLDAQSETVCLNPAYALKQGTLSYLLHLWTEMYLVVPSAETDFVGDFRR